MARIGRRGFVEADNPRAVTLFEFGETHYPYIVAQSVPI